MRPDPPDAPLPDGASARCRRCGATLYRERRDGLNHVLMLTLAALILFVLAHSFPFMTFKLEGREQVSTLLTGDIQLYRDGMWPLALLVLFTRFARAAAQAARQPLRAPAAQARRAELRSGAVFRYTEIVHTWAMMEVYVLGRDRGLRQAHRRRPYRARESRSGRSSP